MLIPPPPLGTGQLRCNLGCTLMKKRTVKAAFNFSLVRVGNPKRKVFLTPRVKVGGLKPSFGPNPLIQHRLPSLNKAYLVSTLPGHT